MTTTLESLTGKDYVSHSAINTWLNCGWQYYLSRVHHVPENPSYWLVGGKAVHECTEKYDFGHLKDVNEDFLEAWNRNYEQSDNGLPFRAGGRATKAYPDKEDASWWLQHGPQMVSDWITWRHESGYQMFVLPEGEQAIETELSQELAGVKMRGFLDRLMVSPDGEVVVVDIKTGSKAPGTDTQLGTYAILVEKTFGVKVTKGAYWMSRTGELTPLIDLTHHTEARLASHINGFKRAIENKIFLPNPGFMCGTCSVNKACFAVNGPDSHLYPELLVEEN